MVNPVKQSAAKSATPAQGGDKQPGQSTGDAGTRCQAGEPSMISKVFVDRPRLASVVSIVLVVAGLLAI